MPGLVLGPDEANIDDFGDYDFGDKQLPVVGPDSSNAQEDATETDNDNNFIGEGALYLFFI